MKPLGPRHKCLDLRPRLTVRGDREGGVVIVKQLLSSRVLRRRDARNRVPWNGAACDAVVAVAMRAVPSKFSVSNLAAAVNKVTGMVVFVKASEGH
jgi:hypothetical protein